MKGTTGLDQDDVVLREGWAGCRSVRSRHTAAPCMAMVVGTSKSGSLRLSTTWRTGSRGTAAARHLVERLRTTKRAALQQDAVAVVRAATVSTATASPGAGSTLYRVPALLTTSRVPPSGVAAMPLALLTPAPAASPVSGRVTTSPVGRRPRERDPVQHGRLGVGEPGGVARDDDVVDEGGAVGEVEDGDLLARAGVVDVGVAGRPAGDEEQPTVDLDADGHATVTVDEDLALACAQVALPDRAVGPRAGVDRGAGPVAMPSGSQPLGSATVSGNCSARAVPIGASANTAAKVVVRTTSRVFIRLRYVAVGSFVHGGSTRRGRPPRRELGAPKGGSPPRVDHLTSPGRHGEAQPFAVGRTPATPRGHGEVARAHIIGCDSTSRRALHPIKYGAL